MTESHLEHDPVPGAEVAGVEVEEGADLDGRVRLVVKVLEAGHLDVGEDPAHAVAGDVGGVLVEPSELDGEVAVELHLGVVLRGLRPVEGEDLEHGVTFEDY